VVTRGSFLILKAGPSRSFGSGKASFSHSASGTIVRNLCTANGLSSRPVRSCEKTIGRPMVKRMASAAMAPTTLSPGKASRQGWSSRSTGGNSQQLLPVSWPLATTSGGRALKRRPCMKGVGPGRLQVSPSFENIPYWQP